jgi:hypothetical protein
MVVFGMNKPLCTATDDNGVVCNRPMSKREIRDDGMCSRCAELIWNNFSKPLWNNQETIPVIFTADQSATDY